MSRNVNRNGASGLPGMKEIVELASLLRESGDKVLSASSKLSFSTKLLHDLSEAFSLIIDETDDLECSFQVCNSSRNEVFRDIKFLHDFVQKTIGLKIQHNPSDAKIIVDITKFRHLKYLELHKVPIEMVKGLQGVRGQLECIICSGGRGINNIHGLLATCGADKGAGFIWGSLHRLALPYNGLQKLDNSLEYAPWLETLDLSHNAISRASELEYLPNLRNINLGYNNLEVVPLFNKTSYHTLQKLILKNNYIDNLNGLQRLECLTELDLSHNCLMDHAALWPLETMSMLIWICLDGNPLSYHPRHRLHTMKYLHPALSDGKFILDDRPLDKSEKLFVSENRVSMMRRARMHHDSFSSTLTSSTQQDNSVVSDIIAPSTSDSLTKFQPGKRRKNMQEAIIDEDGESDWQHLSKPKPSLISSSYLDSSLEHLETKREILALRAKYGEENWLSAHHSAARVQSLMGIEHDATGTSPVALLSSSFSDDKDHAIGAAADDTACISPILPIAPVQLPRVAIGAISGDDSKTPERILKDDIDEEIVVELDPEDDTEETVTLKAESQEVLELSYDPDEEKGDLYLVQKKNNRAELEDIFLVITPEDIKERDFMNGKIKFRWATNTVLSCVLGRGTPTTVDITFDTTRKDREARTYIVELSEAKKIVQTLNETIKTQPMVFKVFKCMKCATHFSQDADNNIVTSQSAGVPPKCPACKSGLVIQTDELSTPSSGIAGPILEKVEPDSSNEASGEANLPHSSSQSSIGSATSLEGSRESTPSTGTVTKKYESDIEILSNPSQSSIEVLDDSSKSTTPRRKKSSEEKKSAVAPLLTIPDTTLVMVGLTESSSSGSLTDSVCTAYENKTAKVSDKTGLSISKTSNDAEMNKSLDTENVSSSVSNLSSILGGLLRSMEIGPSKDSISKSDRSSEFVGSNIQYSYTDFSDVDHRIKLHIILNVFEHENEELAFLLRADILTQSSAETFPGCLVMSTAKVYLLRISGLEGEDPQQWLHKELSWTIDRLRSFAPLPFKQGVLVEFQQPNKSGENASNTSIMCILQDFQRTSNFLFYLTDSPLPAGCEVEFVVPQYCNNSMRKILQSAKYHKEEDPVRLLAVFSSAELRPSTDVLKLKQSSLIVTSSTLIVLQDKVHWLLSENDKLPPILAEQELSNLIKVDFCGTSIVLHFLDEISASNSSSQFTDASWTFTFVSANAAETVINSIRPPWESLFFIPLQVNNEAMTESSSSQIET
ncbi:hypothetical protein QAD02_005918 [Eretmocerus hayati]|uniref:Uncharacterized protein n=1 Tax=Eretmocerus hayati TaxID=131215 RepID=A0ACC2N0L4_9HYME|nr:hypothetical protein QAD02_005918 [Eretmocerus hayati]